MLCADFVVCCARCCALVLIDLYASLNTANSIFFQEHSSFVAPGAAPLPGVIRTCPASLGVRCGGVGEGEGEEDEVTPIISQGCILPAQGTTTVKLLPSAVIEVVEVGQAGEGGAATARVLGTLSFDDAAASGKADQAVEVKVGLTLRSEGVLKVEALATGSSTKKELVIGHEGPGDS